MSMNRDLRKALNSAYLKANTPRILIDNFKIQANKLLENLNRNETEEFYKNALSDFLKESYYKDKHYINVKDKKDLVIHNDKKANSSVGVIIEVKRPSNNAEMVSCVNLNKKALQELVLYYLRERISQKNLQLKHLIITNINEWFIFDARLFERYFAENKKLVDLFTQFENKTLAGYKTQSFYEDIAAPEIEACQAELEFTYFNLTDYHALLTNTEKEKDKQLIPLFKLLSPEHLLKLSFSNDANSLNEEFYNELLHIIGLEEVKENGKKLIKRKSESARHSASFLEQTIHNIKNRGEITQEQALFDAAIELCITWINRILFLKLLEAQLMTYHNHDKLYQFFNTEKLTCFSDLNYLFFDVLAIKEEERSQPTQNSFSHIPYLNSSLFERTELENKTLEISGLRRELLPILATTVLKNERGQKLTGKLDILTYLFDFLAAYDFSNDSKEEIKENNKSLISASVLGLIFEKINGYKDGSFFTPSIITMYMSRETMRLAVVQKFNEIKGLGCETFDDLKSVIKINTKNSRKEANDIVNSIKVCDPAVGSGHFLVSVLNEFIAIKSELGILTYQDDENYTGLSNCLITVDNDELKINHTNNEHTYFEYHINNKESQRIQETLFHEKQKIIENCLFGVDINPNSVKICRLRLWIELLKHAYYKDNGKLETLPNIDINIQVGNSLISRFALDADLKSALKRSNVNIDDYKKAFHDYQNAQNKQEKKAMERLIKNIKDNFYVDAYENDPSKKLLAEKISAKYALNNASLIEETENEKDSREKAIKRIELEIARLTTEIENFKNNPLYENAFEWRFEFPEALDNDGNFVGFDVVIGNPPYGVEIKNEYRNHVIKNFDKMPDYEIYYYFIEISNFLLKENGVSSLIIPNTFLFNVYAKQYRLNLLKKWNIKYFIDCTTFKIFDTATVRNTITLFVKSKNIINKIGYKNTNGVLSFLDLINKKTLFLSSECMSENNKNWGLLFRLDDSIFHIISKIEKSSVKLKQLFPEYSQGLIAYDKYQGQSKDIIEKRAYHYNHNNNGNFKKWLWGEDVTRYVVNWNGKEWLDYCSDIANPRQPKFFQGERILIREITNPSIFAAHCNEELYHDPAIIVVLGCEHISVKFLLAVLNSRLASFYHFNSSPKATKGAFPKILVKDIEDFPLPKSTRVQRDKIETLVNSILDAKKSGQDTSQLEADIDSLVYDLYGLTEQERALVEGKNH